MRMYRRALIVMSFVAALCVAAPLVGTTASTAQPERTAWTSSQIQDTQLRTPLITTQSLAPLGRYFKAVTAALATSSTLPPTSVVAPSAPASPPVTPVVSTSPAPTTTAVPVTSTGSDLLSTAPGYVQAAFACIRGIESHNEPTVVNSSSGDGGLYQFNSGTWEAVIGRANGVGFPPRAEEASVVQQDNVAFWAYEQDGFQPWNGDQRCWE